MFLNEACDESLCIRQRDSLHLFVLKSNIVKVANGRTTRRFGSHDGFDLQGRL